MVLGVVLRVVLRVVLGLLGVGSSHSSWCEQQLELFFAFGVLFAYSAMHKPERHKI
jgi:hypothetical protein